MSLKEPRAPSMASGALNRSRSFAGLANHRNSPSSPTTIRTKVLGQNFRSPKSNRKSMPNHGFTMKKTVKVPKVPRPSRATTIFHSIKQGLRECVQATEDDISQLRVSESASMASSTGQGRLHDLEKQVKAAERYKKRLEFHLAKIEELEENYLLQQQLREGAKNMAKAYVSLPGNHQKESLLNVKYGYKECTQNMCAIEAQLENMLGTFHCKMRGMIGFARLIPGDVFEISIRHGPQKWKTKGRVKAEGQVWDSDATMYKALLGEVFTIKAVECKSLAKSVVLGEKNCETKDLFSSHPQMMTVNLNTNGSLKLSVIITWNPLDGIDESIVYYEPPPKSQGTPNKKRMSVLDENRLSTYSTYSSCSTGSGDVDIVQLSQRPTDQAASSDRQASHLHTENHVGDNRSETDSRPHSVDLTGTTRDSIADSTDLNMQKPKLFDMRLLADALECTGDRQEAATLEEALHSLRLTLEDYQGQYPELQKLEEQIAMLDKALKKNQGAGSARSSNVSISIEAALGAFDFLESEECVDGYGSANMSRGSSLDQLEASCTLSPESTAKTADSGIESLANQLNEDRGFGDSIGSSPEPPTTGNEQVDQALLWHLAYCDKLLENLGGFGPLKCKEIYSLDKLQKQADIIEKLLSLATIELLDLQTILSGITHNKALKQFWVKCTDQNVLYTCTERFQAQLEKSFGDQIRNQYDIPTTKVFRVLIAKVLDVPLYDPESGHGCPNITLHQLMSYFGGEDSNLEEFVQEMAGELWVCNRLRSGNTDIVIKTILTFGDTVPPPECLRIVALLLITSNTEIKTTVVSYLRGVAGNPSQRDKAMVIFVEALEDRNADVRCAACMALGLLNAVESMDQLRYVCQTDSSSVVKGKAKDTLLSFGDEGRKAFEETELSAHGFQGVHVKL